MRDIAWDRLGDLTKTERAAVTAVGVIADATSGLGIDKWSMIQSRLQIAAARADRGVDIWTEVAPHLRPLGDGVWLRNDEAATLLAALAVDGVRDLIAEDLDLIVLRVRVGQMKAPKAAADQGVLV